MAYLITIDASTHVLYLIGQLGQLSQLFVSTLIALLIDIAYLIAIEASTHVLNSRG